MNGNCGVDEWIGREVKKSSLEERTAPARGDMKTDGGTALSGIVTIPTTLAEFVGLGPDRALT